MQHAIAGRVDNRESVVRCVRRAVDAAHDSGVPVIYSQHYSLPFESEDVTWIRTWWRRSGMESPTDLSPLALPGSDGWQFLEELAPEARDIVVPKTRPSLFVGTPAREILASRDVRTLVITGVTTDRGVLTTAQRALLVDLSPVIVSDAVGS
jgi:nicotinamidase-related amidase